MPSIKNSILGQNNKFGGELMFQARFLTKEDHEKIRENRKKEAELRCYYRDAYERMKPRPCTLKLKDTSKYD